MVAPTESGTQYILLATSQNGQYGTNNCNTGTTRTSKCQTAWIKYGLLSFATVGVVTDFVEGNSQLCKRPFVSGYHISYNPQFMLVCWHHKITDPQINHFIFSVPWYRW